MVHSIAPWLLFAVTTATSATAQKGFPIELGAGPLICFAITASSEPHQEDLYAANCHADQKAVRFWRNSGNTRVLARLDQTRILIASYGEPYALIMVDTATGAHQVLADGSPHSFVGLHGDDILYLGDDRWNKGENHLFARSWRHATPGRQVAEPLLHTVPVISGNLAIGVCDELKTVCVIGLTHDAIRQPEKNTRKLYDLPSDAHDVNVALSPGGQRLAIATAVSGRGHLAVVDIGSSKVLRTWQDLNITLSMLSSSTPTLEVAWFDDLHVVTSETIGTEERGGEFAFVRRSIETGKVTEEDAYGTVGIHHRSPTPAIAAPNQTPHLSVASQADQFMLLQAGQATPVHTMPQDYKLGAYILVAPSGEFAIATQADDPKLVSLYRAGKTPLALSDTGGKDWTWLPRAQVVESPSK